MDDCYMILLLMTMMSSTVNFFKDDVIDEGSSITYFGSGDGFLEIKDDKSADLIREEWYGNN